MIPRYVVPLALLVLGTSSMAQQKKTHKAKLSVSMANVAVVATDSLNQQRRLVGDLEFTVNSVNYEGLSGQLVFSGKELKQKDGEELKSAEGRTVIIQNSVVCQVQENKECPNPVKVVFDQVVLKNKMYQIHLKGLAAQLGFRKDQKELENLFCSYSFPLERHHGHKSRVVGGINRLLLGF